MVMESLVYPSQAITPGTEFLLDKSANYHALYGYQEVLHGIVNPCCSGLLQDAL